MGSALSGETLLGKNRTTHVKIFGCGFLSAIRSLQMGLVFALARIPPPGPFVHFR